MVIKSYQNDEPTHLLGALSNCWFDLKNNMKYYRSQLTDNVDKIKVLRWDNSSTCDSGNGLHKSRDRVHENCVLTRVQWFSEEMSIFRAMYARRHDTNAFIRSFVWWKNRLVSFISLFTGIRRKLWFLKASPNDFITITGNTDACEKQLSSESLTGKYGLCIFLVRHTVMWKKRFERIHLRLPGQLFRNVLSSSGEVDREKNDQIKDDGRNEPIWLD